MLLNKQTAINVKFDIGYTHTRPPIDYTPQTPWNKESDLETVSENVTKPLSEQNGLCCDESRSCDSVDGVSESVVVGDLENNNE